MYAVRLSCHTFAFGMGLILVTAGFFGVLCRMNDATCRIGIMRDGWCVLSVCRAFSPLGRPAFRTLDIVLYLSQRQEKATSKCRIHLVYSFWSFSLCSCVYQMQFFARQVHEIHILRTKYQVHDMYSSSSSSSFFFCG